MDISQLLLYGLLVAGFLVFNALLQRAARRAQQRQEQAQAQQQEVPAASDDEPLDPGWGRGPAADRRSNVAPVETTRRVPANAATVAPPPHRPSAKALFRSRHDLRRAIVVMTVLGPCRALEPADRR